MPFGLAGCATGATRNRQAVREGGDFALLGREYSEGVDASRDGDLDASFDHRVEYFQPLIQDGEPYMGSESEPPRADARPRKPPELFEDYPFDGPMAGHNPEMPWHYDQHVWLYAHNPDGLFAMWNPALSCPDTAP